MTEPRGELVKLNLMRNHLEAQVLGQTEAVELSLTALLAGGHVLLEGPPGVGKTSLAQGIASNFKASFRRLQMTSDMLPSDIVGTLRPKEGEFEFRPGPIFCHVLLADELNRTGAKTQSALLEAMAEHRVTVDGVTHILPDPFFVMATQNPLEFQGVYPLAESQLDRFMMHISLGVPDSEAELKLMQRHARGGGSSEKLASLTPEDLIHLREACKKIFVEESIVTYTHAVARELRRARDVAHGASVRAILQTIDAAKARAFLAGREFVLPGDITSVAPALLGHRLVLRGPPLDAEKRKELVRETLATVAIPR